MGLKLFLPIFLAIVEFMISSNLMKNGLQRSWEFPSFPQLLYLIVSVFILGTLTKIITKKIEKKYSPNKY